MYNVVNNPIPHSGLFFTPTLEQLQSDIESLPTQHKALVYSYVMATLNACHKLVENEILSKEIFAS